VQDNKTGLTWQRSVPSSTYTWADATSYCQALNLGGFSSGWRLPAKKELETLVDERVQNQAIDATAFSERPCRPILDVHALRWRFGPRMVRRLRLRQLVLRRHDEYQQGSVCALRTGLTLLPFDALTPRKGIVPPRLEPLDDHPRHR